MRIGDHVYWSQTDFPCHGRVAGERMPPRRRHAFGPRPRAERPGGLADPRREAVDGHRDAGPSPARGGARPDAAGGGAALRVVQRATGRRRPWRRPGRVRSGRARRGPAGAVGGGGPPRLGVDDGDAPSGGLAAGSGRAAAVLDRERRAGAARRSGLRSGVLPAGASGRCHRLVGAGADREHGPRP